MEGRTSRRQRRATEPGKGRAADQPPRVAICGPNPTETTRAIRNRAQGTLYEHRHRFALCVSQLHGAARSEGERGGGEDENFGIIASCACLARRRNGRTRRPARDIAVMLPQRYPLCRPHASRSLARRPAAVAARPWPHPMARASARPAPRR